MAFELDPSVSITKAVRKAGRDRIDDALELLDAIVASDPVAVEDAVHDARKRCKQARSLARLIRPSIGEQRFEAFNSMLREAGRQLAPIRDSHAVLTTFDRLLAVNDAAADPQLAAVRRAHATEADRATNRAIQDGRLLDTSRELLRSARDEIGHWDVPGGFDAVSAGLAPVYRRGRRALAAARAAPSDESVHELRKSVKHLYHAVELIAAAAPSVLTPLGEQLDKLGDALGDDHDLAVLVARLDDDPARHGGEAAVSRAVSMARSQQTDLRRRAFRLAASLYAERPKPFTRRIESYWSIHAAEGPELETGKIGDLSPDQAGT